MASPADEPASWSCGVCTFQNHGMVRSCEMCETARPADAPAAAAAPVDAAAAALDGFVLLESPSGGAVAAGALPSLPGRRPEDPFVAAVRRATGAEPNEQMLRGVERLLRCRLHLEAFELPPGWLRGVDDTAIEACARAAARAAALSARLVAAAGREEERRAAESCCACGRPGHDAYLLPSDECGHPTCAPCARAACTGALEDGAAARLRCVSPGCEAGMPPGHARQVLSAAEYERYLAACMEGYLEQQAGRVRAVRCPAAGCGSAMEVETLDEAAVVVPDQIRLRDDAGRVFSRAAFVHFSRFRVRCRECQASFCAECLEEPYHGGFTCAQWKEYGQSRHCRFCQRQLAEGETLAQMRRPPRHLAKAAAACRDTPALADVCAERECAERALAACRDVLECGHPCGGALDEAAHPPCLVPACVEARAGAACAAAAAAAGEQTADDLCNICWVEGLGQAPVVRLGKCGHAFHHHCVATKIRSGWPGQRITFGHLTCPLCSAELDCGGNRRLAKLLRPVEELRALLTEKALRRLEVEKMKDDEKLTDPASRFYQKPVDYAMASFAYYHCFKCKKPYFGGRRDCEQNAAADKRPPEEFVCYDCGDAVNVLCDNEAHKEYWLWKCRFCCNTAVWFCWGTTRFCEPCHSNEPWARAKWPRSKFKQCRGGKNCPSGGDHAPNGSEAECEQAIGCAVCNNERKALADDAKRDDVPPLTGGGRKGRRARKKYLKQREAERAAAAGGAKGAEEQKDGGGGGGGPVSWLAGLMGGKH